MLTNIIILPIIVPFITALILIAWRKPTVLRRVFLGTLSFIILLLAIWISHTIYYNGILVLRFGGWMPPFGIVLTVDLLSGIMLCLSTFITFCAVLYGFAETPLSSENPLRSPLVMFLMAGMNMAFSTGDIFNLYVAFEVMLIASYALMTLESNNRDTKHAFPYLTINLFGSAIFLAAAGLTYSLLGTLNYADIAMRSADYIHDPRLLIIAVMYTVVFGIKAGMFPLYYWLPKSYTILPTPLAGLYGGMLTKVGVYCLLRLFCTIMPHGLVEIHWLVLILSAPTMIFAVIGAMSKNFIRGILSYHIISQVGFMLLATGFFTPLGITACIFYIVHHIIVKSSLFLIGGIAATINQTDNLKKMGHLWHVAPVVGILFLLQALSLAGIPPLSGFWGKYLIIVEGLKLNLYFFVAVSILASILTLVSMIKIWQASFWETPDNVTVQINNNRWKWMTAVVALMAVVSITIGIGAEFYIGIAQKASDMILDQGGYIKAVLY